MYLLSLQNAMFLSFTLKPIFNSKLIHILDTGTKLMLTSLIIYVDYSLPIIIYKHMFIKKLKILRGRASYPFFTNR